MIFNAVVIAGDQRGIDIYCSHRGKDRRIMLVLQPQAVGAAGIWVHNFPYGISIAFNRWGSSDERAIDPPLRFADSDGQRFELYMAQKQNRQINRRSYSDRSDPD